MFITKMGFVGGLQVTRSQSHDGELFCCREPQPPDAQVDHHRHHHSGRT